MNRILNLAKSQNQKPSNVLCIEDEYTAFCFDEACEYIMINIRNGEEPQYEKKKVKVTSMAEYFKELGV